MKLTKEQLQELHTTGQIEFPIGTIKRIEWKQKRYWDVGEKKFKKNTRVSRQYRMILDKELVAFLRVMDC